MTASLIEKEIPDVVAEADYPPWLQAVAAPIGDDGSGVDPRYGDRFGLVKGEIDKLGGNNYDLVRSQARAILAEEGKDLRVAGYLVMATAYLEGFAGLGHAIEAYRVILERYWDGCHPTRESGRRQAVAWLGNERMAGFLQRANDDALTLGQAEELRESVTAFNRLVRERLGGDAPQWESLQQRVERLRAAKSEARDNLEREQRAQDERMRQSTSDNAPLNEERAETMVVKLARHYREKGEYGRALALLRGYRWGSVVLPPHDNGRTRIPVFRVAAFDEIAAMEAAGSPPAQIFGFCEELLMEPGGQWSLDLQALARKSLVALGDPGAVKLLDSEVVGLLKRCSGLVGLSFDNGVPFAGPETMEWLRGLETATESPGKADLAADDTAQAIIERAEQATADKGRSGLLEGLAVLRELAERNGREAFIKRFQQARLCVRTGQGETAGPILDGLEREIGRLDLAAWEPALAIGVWRLHLQVLQQQWTRADGAGKAAIARRIDEIHALLCTTDVEEAVRMNRSYGNQKE